MQAAIEQRAREGARVPLDLWIRLNHEDYEDKFDADGVDLSTGGIALRAEYLPEVGDRLRCRFDCPPTGAEIEVDGEVVWAHDAGERSGEFGLCFGDLGEEVQASLRDLVTHLGGDVRTVARLHLDGVASPIEAEVLERDAQWLTVEQELPFLRMGMGVTIENGGGAPRGKLASVDLRIEDGTPRLVLSVELQRLDEGLDDERLDGEGLDDEQAQLSAPDPRHVETLDDPAGDTSDSTLQDFDLPAELSAAVDSAAPLTRDDVKVFAIEADGMESDAMESHLPGSHDPDREAITPGDLMAEPMDAVSGLQAKLAPLVASVKVMLLSLHAKAKPALAATWTRLVAFSRAVVAKAGPKANAFFRALVALGSKIRLPKGKRRTTAAPRKRIAGAPARRKQHAEPEPTPKKSGRRILALSALAFVGVGAAVYALAGGDDEPAEVELPAASTPPAPRPELSVEDAPILEAPSLLEATPEEMIVTEPAQPEPEGGPLAEPSYPSLSDGAPSGPVTEGQTFGAASVPDARSATIRMSQPVATIRGTRREDGFSITVPGALALDRAGPIAAANPSVERAMILNRGDHAVLTVRFVAGRTPPYRVVAQGRAIVVDIGR